MTAAHIGRPPVDLTDIDDVAVELAVRGGQPVTVGRADRIAAVRLLTGSGHSRPTIAEHVGASVRTIGRDLALIRST